MKTTRQDDLAILLHECIQQRAELLAALKEVTVKYRYLDLMPEVLTKCRSAIAKAEAP